MKIIINYCDNDTNVLLKFPSTGVRFNKSLIIPPENTNKCAYMYMYMYMSYVHTI